MAGDLLMELIDRRRIRLIPLYRDPISHTTNTDITKNAITDTFLIDPTTAPSNCG